jgi:hypothetical protein
VDWFQIATAVKEATIESESFEQDGAGIERVRPEANPVS